MSFPSLDLDFSEDFASCSFERLDSDSRPDARFDREADALEGDFTTPELLGDVSLFCFVLASARLFVDWVAKRAFDILPKNPLAWKIKECQSVTDRIRIAMDIMILPLWVLRSWFSCFCETACFVYILPCIRAELV